MAATIDLDQRQHKRWRYTLSLTLYWSGGEQEVHTSDISLGGVFVETSQVLDPSTPVKIQFRLFEAGRPVMVVVHGKVARRVSAEETGRPHPNVGLGIAFERFHSGEAALTRVLSALGQTRKHARTLAVGQDKRHSPRVQVGLAVRWGSEDPPQHDGHLVDLSSGSGFMLHANPPQQVGTRIYLHFSLPVDGQLKEVRAAASVVRSQQAGGQSGMGVVFEMSTVSVAQISQFVARVSRPREQASRRYGSAVKDQKSPRPATPKPVSLAAPTLNFEPGWQNIRPLWVAKVVWLPLVLTLLALLTF